jgi:RNA recognition motif-containing protein
MTEKHDNEAYLGNINLKAAGVETEFTKEQIEEYAKCVGDPMYFIENFVKIVSLDDGLVQFEPYEYQKKMIHSMHNDRFVIAKLPDSLASQPLLFHICFTMFYLILKRMLQF